jgi:hypothetical protein
MELGVATTYIPLLGAELLNWHSNLFMGFTSKPKTYSSLGWREEEDFCLLLSWLLFRSCLRRHRNSGTLECLDFVFPLGNKLVRSACLRVWFFFSFHLKILRHLYAACYQNEFQHWTKRAHNTNVISLHYEVRIAVTIICILVPKFYPLDQWKKRLTNQVSCQ